MSNEPVQDTRSTADQAPAPLPYAGAIRWLGAAGALLALICLLTGVAMLVMKWVGAAPPALMSQIPLVLLPRRLYCAHGRTHPVGHAPQQGIKI